jgi:hypothetical protein
VPKPLESLSRSLADKSKFKTEDGTVLMMLKRLLYMAEKRVFVLSASRSSCSPVTIAIPNKQIIDSKQSVALAINDRTYIENALMSKCIIPRDKPDISGSALMTIFQSKILQNKA